MFTTQKSGLYFFEQLFGSRTRVKLLRLFLLSSQDAHFYMREIARSVSEHVNSVRRELDNLEALGLIIKSKQPDSLQRIYYTANPDFVLYNELRALLMKSQLLLRSSLTDSLKDIGAVNYLILTGMFTGANEADTDMLIVGRINNHKLAEIIKQFEKEIGKPIRYTLMSTNEFLYRYQLTDRFLYTIFEQDKIVLIDELGEKLEGQKDFSRKKIKVKE